MARSTALARELPVLGPASAAAGRASVARDWPRALSRSLPP